MAENESLAWNRAMLFYTIDQRAMQKQELSMTKWNYTLMSRRWNCRRMERIVKIQFPLDGDILTPFDGRMEGDVLYFEVRTDGPAVVNGIPCRKEGDVYVAELAMAGNELELQTESGEAITVYRQPRAFKKYRLAIDDVIWSLRELAHGNERSLFDHPFFRLFRDLHEEFGTKTHLNLYFTDGEGFDLSQFPDRFKQEFENSVDWMQLTFHARADLPSRIYREASYEEVYRDFWQVTNEIVRFAGERIWRCGDNGLHFAETTREGSRALRDCGCFCQVGYFIFDKQGEPAVSYYLDQEQTRHMAKRDFWYDRSERILFSRDKLVLDAHTPQEIPLLLDRMLAENPQGMGTANFVTHEQYFYPHYSHYRPDYAERIRAAVRWATENCYQPAFLDQCLERPEK